MAIIEKKAYKKEILHWLGSADEDYLAARLLLLNGYLKQGTIFSNTAIEKYLKTIIFAFGDVIPKEHDTLKLYGIVSAKAPELKVINVGFLLLLSKAYHVRYTDQLPIGYNIHLDQIKLLAELDRTVFILRKDFKFQTKGQTGDKKIITRLDVEAEENNPVFLDKNIAFGDYDPIQLFKEKTTWLSLLVYEAHNIIEGMGDNEGTLDDGKFDIVGIKQGP